MLLETIGERAEGDAAARVVVILHDQWTNHPIGRPMWGPCARESEGCLAGTRSQLPELPAQARIEHQGDRHGGRRRRRMSGRCTSRSSTCGATASHLPGRRGKINS
jgi:hypothetical protein